MKTLASKLDVESRLSEIPEGMYQSSLSADRDGLFLPACRLSRKIAKGSVLSDVEECGYINLDGQWVIEPRYVRTLPFQGDYGVVTKTWDGASRYNFVDRNGHEILSSNFYSVHLSKDKTHYEVCESEYKCGVMDFNLDWIIQPNYRNVSQIFKNYFALGISSDEYRVMDTETQELVLGHCSSSNIRFSIPASEFLCGADSKIFSLEGQVRKIDDVAKDDYVGFLCENYYSHRKGTHQYFRSFDGVVSRQLPYEVFWLADKSDQICPKYLVVKIDDNNTKLLSFDDFNTVIENGYLNFIDDEEKLFKERNSNGYAGIVSSSNENILNNDYLDVKLLPDNTIVLKSENNRFEYGKYEIVDGRMKINFLVEKLFSDYVGSQEIGSYAEFNYGDSYDFTKGSYWVSPSGEILPKTASMELEIFKSACDGALNQSNREVQNLIVGCRYYYLTLSREGNLDARHNYGYARLFTGHNDGVSIIQSAAEAGHAESQMQMGMTYHDGAESLGINKDGSQAVYWWRKAAEQGHTQAQFNLGVSYMDGIYTAKDLSEATHWFNLAAGKGHEDSIHNLKLFNNASSRSRTTGNTLLNLWPSGKTTEIDRGKCGNGAGYKLWHNPSWTEQYGAGTLSPHTFSSTASGALNEFCRKFD